MSSAAPPAETKQHVKSKIYLALFSSLFFDILKVLVYIKQISAVILEIVKVNIVLYKLEKLLRYNKNNNFFIVLKPLDSHGIQNNHFKENYFNLK